ncbi:hypothetical protein ACTXPS_08630 [Brachybacterium tyrofermentans]|uniref:hypothetical protein n=1 Tax=Brachybacterium tyrofermentans TaxID=47848 RepID=UPI003FD2235F
MEAAPEKRLATQAQDTGERVALRLDRTEVLDAIPAYVIILKSSEGQIRRRVFLSLHSAVKACERAQQRGHAATLELVQYVSRGER